MEFSILLRLVGLMNFIPTLSHLINIQGREASLGDFVKKNVTLACIWTFIDQFLLNLM